MLSDAAQDGRKEQRYWYMQMVQSSIDAASAQSRLLCYVRFAYKMLGCTPTVYLSTAAATAAAAVAG